MRNPVKSEIIFPVEGFPVPENGLEMEILKKNFNFLKFKMLWRFFEILKLPDYVPKAKMSNKTK